MAFPLFYLLLHLLHYNFSLMTEKNAHVLPLPLQGGHTGLSSISSGDGNHVAPALAFFPFPNS